jgi:hypothetical protein
MIAATSNITAQIEISMHAFLISVFHLCWIIRHVNQKLPAIAVEYAKNSSHVNGKINNNKNNSTGLA